MNGILIIIRCVAGSGKSSFANLIWQSEVIFEADKYFYKDGTYQFDKNKLHDAHKWCQKQVEEAMILHDTSKGQYCAEIIVSNTSTTEKEMQPYIDLAKKYDYKVTSLIVENRHGGKSIHSVPEETIEKMKQRFEIKL